MSVISGTGTSLSSSFFLRKFYKNCSNAATSSKRSDYATNRLSQADADALHKAVKELRGYKFTSDEGSSIYSNIMAFVDTYNNTLDSASSSSDSAVKRYAKQLQSLTSKYEDELDAIGVTVNSDGSLTANETLVQKASVSDAKVLFSQDSDFSTKVYQYSKRLENRSENVYTTELITAAKKQEALLAAQQEALLTGIGTTVDLSL